MGAVWLALLGPLLALPGTASLAGSQPVPEEIFGGTDVAPCGWPTTVSMGQLCTGTLIHPEVVVYAAHCGANFTSVRFGENNASGLLARDVATTECAVYPGGATPGRGIDWAYCVLAEPQNDIPVVPPLMGCEVDLLTPGQEVTIVGFGDADTGPYGIKREVQTQIVEVAGSEVKVGGEGKDSCTGDSGGPVFVKLPAAYGMASWRVFGITSYGGACGEGGWYSTMHLGMAWFEEQTGRDLTPCHEADGTWSPGPGCSDFPMSPGVGAGSWEAGCAGGLVGGVEASCGDANPDLGGTGTGAPTGDDGSGSEGTAGGTQGEGGSSSGDAGSDGGGQAAPEHSNGCGCRFGPGDPAGALLVLAGLIRRRASRCSRRSA